MARTPTLDAFTTRSQEKDGDAPQVPAGRSRPPVAGAPRRLAVVTTAVVTALAAVVLGGTAVLTGFERTNGGEIAVIRNGGPFDDNKIRQVVRPASSRTWTGMFSSAHRYPAQERLYTISADGNGDRPGVDVVKTPTSDGVDVGIEGTIFFTLNQDEAVLEQFDDSYGTRTFTGLDGERYYPWQGDEGWVAFLDQVVRPVINNDLRVQVNNFKCVELISTCALVQNASLQAGQAPTGSAAPLPGGGQALGSVNNVNIARVQEAVNVSLAQNLSSMLQGDYLVDIRFNLARVTLSPEVQGAVDKAQAAFGQITEAQARVASAEADARANQARQRGYQDCPSCAQIDMLKAIPPSVTTFAPGSGFAVTPQG